jgi:hypothetical protein
VSGIGSPGRGAARDPGGRLAVRLAEAPREILDVAPAAAQLADPARLDRLPGLGVKAGGAEDLVLLGEGVVEQRGQLGEAFDGVDRVRQRGGHGSSLETKRGRGAAPGGAARWDRVGARSTGCSIPLYFQIDRWSDQRSPNRPARDSFLRPVDFVSDGGGIDRFS